MTTQTKSKTIIEYFEERDGFNQTNELALEENYLNDELEVHKNLGEIYPR